MKPTYFFLIFFLGSLMACPLFAQSNISNGHPVSLLDMTTATILAFSGQDKAATGNKQIPSSNTGVYLQQIGNRNFATVDISSHGKDLQLVQHGNDNFLGIWVTAKAMKGNVVQNGNNNSAFDFADDRALNLSLNLSQNGNGHYFESHGTNSIGNNLKFEMTGDSQSLIVRNFK